MKLTFESYSVPDVYDPDEVEPELEALIRLYMAADGDEDGDFDERAVLELDKLAQSEVFVVREESRRLLGFLAVNDREQPSGERTLFVEAIAVDKRLRNRKIGSRILSFIELLAMDRECNTVQGYALDDDRW